MIRMTLSEYLRKPKDYRVEWTTERWDIPNWKEERKKYMGKRTLMTNVDGATMWKTQVKGSIKSEDMNWDTVDEPEIIVDFGGLYNTCTVDTKPIRSGNTITWNYTCEWEYESNKYTIGERQRVDIWVRIEDKTVYKFELWSTNQWK